MFINHITFMTSFTLFLVVTHIFMFWLGCRFTNNVNQFKKNEEDEQDS